MEFVTIHDLSRELNTPARVIRYRLIHLIMEGKLKENARTDIVVLDEFAVDVSASYSTMYNPLGPFVKLALRPHASNR